MIKIFSKTLALLIVTLAATQTIIAYAAGGPASVLSFSTSSSSATADGTDSITVSVSSFWYICNHGSYSSSIDECDYLTPPGYSGNTILAADEHTYLSVDPGAAISASELTTNSSGSGSFTVTSSTPATYNVYATSSSGFVRAQAAVTFAEIQEEAPDPVVTPEPSQEPTQTPTQQPAHESTTEETAEKPVTPKASLVDSDGNKVPTEGESGFTYEEKQPIIISGETVPNGTVKLYIFSEPQEATVTADAEGNWSYTIKTIEPGSHRVEVEVTDPTSGETSERAEIISFNVAQANTENATEQVQATSQDTEENNKAPTTKIALGVTAIIIAACTGLGFWLIKKRKTTVENKDVIQPQTIQDEPLVPETSDTEVEIKSDEEPKN